jgi:hypothetical protein
MYELLFITCIVGFLKASQTFELALDSQAIIDAISRGKIASLLGVEGSV